MTSAYESCPWGIARDSTSGLFATPSVASGSSACHDAPRSDSGQRSEVLCLLSGLVFYRLIGRGLDAPANNGCMIGDATYRGSMPSLHITSGYLRHAPPQWQASAYLPRVVVRMPDNDTSALLLTSLELQLLTGRVKHRMQIDWLVSNNIPYLLDASGRPKVLRKFIESKLSGNADRSGLLSPPYGQQQGSAIRPNFAALDVHASRRRGRGYGS